MKRGRSGAGERGEIVTRGLVDGGAYIAVFRLAEGQEIRVGTLGEVYFESGWYFYVGRAKRGLAARLSRHERKEKVLRWHVDYLSVRAEMVGAMIVEAEGEEECELARQLGEMCERGPRGFGSSDCRCGGHLFLMRGEQWRIKKSREGQDNAPGI